MPCSDGRRGNNGRRVDYTSYATVPHIREERTSSHNAGIAARGCQSESIVQTGRITMKRIVASLITASSLLLVAAGPAFAAGKTLQTPTTGQKGAPTNTCGGTGSTGTPGAAATAAQGSPFNTTANGGLGGTAGLNYAGNPNTHSLANSNSTATVSQYDVACFQVP